MFYDAVKEQNKDVEVVFVSVDRTPEQFNEYYEEMDWLAVPYTETAKRGQLAQSFKIQGLPALFLVDKNVVTKRDTCRMDVTSKGPLCLGDSILWSTQPIRCRRLSTLSRRFWRNVTLVVWY